MEQSLMLRRNVQWRLLPKRDITPIDHCREAAFAQDEVEGVQVAMYPNRKARPRRSITQPFPSAPNQLVIDRFIKRLNAWSS